jgi:hypothetical protein
MKKLTREELKDIKGGLQNPPAGCFCFIPNDNLPGGGLSPDCYFGDNPDLYCPAGELLGCC